MMPNRALIASVHAAVRNYRASVSIANAALNAVPAVGVQSIGHGLTWTYGVAGGLLSLPILGFATKTLPDSLQNKVAILTTGAVSLTTTAFNVTGEGSKLLINHVAQPLVHEAAKQGVGLVKEAGGSLLEVGSQLIRDNKEPITDFVAHGTNVTVHALADVTQTIAIGLFNVLIETAKEKRDQTVDALASAVRDPRIITEYLYGPGAPAGSKGLAEFAYEKFQEIEFQAIAHSDPVKYLAVAGSLGLLAFGTVKYIAYNKHKANLLKAAAKVEKMAESIIPPSEKTAPLNTPSS